MNTSALDALIARQHGVVRRRDVLALGATEDILWRQTRAGTWRVAGPGILVHCTADEGLATDSRVAGLWQPDMILTGPSAAVLWPRSPWIGEKLPLRAMAVSRRSGRGPWCTVRHPKASGARVDGFRVADHTTTVVDLVRFLPDRRQALGIGAATVTSGLVNVEALQARLAVMGSLSGVRQLRWVVGLLAFGVRSVGEYDLHQFLRRYAIEGWRPNYPITVRGRTFWLDVAFPVERVYLEYDGREPHSGDAAFDGDRDRQNGLGASGWAPVRVTNEMLKSDGRRTKLLWDIQATLAGRRPAALAA